MTAAPPAGKSQRDVIRVTPSNSGEAAQCLCGLLRGFAAARPMNAGPRLGNSEEPSSLLPPSYVQVISHSAAKRNILPQAESRLHKPASASAATLRNAEIAPPIGAPPPAVCRRRITPFTLRRSKSHYEDRCSAIALHIARSAPAVRTM